MKDARKIKFDPDAPEGPELEEEFWGKVGLERANDPEKAMEGYAGFGLAPIAPARHYPGELVCFNVHVQSQPVHANVIGARHVAIAELFKEVTEYLIKHKAKMAGWDCGPACEKMFLPDKGDYFFIAFARITAQELPDGEQKNSGAKVPRSNDV